MRTLISLFLVAWAAALSALEVDFQATVDRIRVGSSQPLILSLTITTDESVPHMPAPLLELDEFVVEGPAVSTNSSVTFANSEVRETHTRTLRYTLYPRQTGIIEIAAARLLLDGREYRTSPLEIEVLKAAATGRQQQGGKGGEPENVFVQVGVDRERAYVGQQVTVDYDLYYNVRIYDVGFKEIPSFSGFWSKEVFVAHQLKARQTTHQGVRYNVAPLRRMALFPTSAGRIAVDPLVVSFEVPVRRGRRGLLDVFGASMQPMVAASSGLEIDVLPLPAAGQPADFAGAVGRFQLAATAQPRQVSVGDPITLRVTVSGYGSMVEVGAPDLSALAGFKVYEPTLEAEETINNGIVGGRRTFEYILIPDQAAALEIPDIRFPYFDPEAAAYQMARTAPIEIRVGGGGLQETAAAEYGLSRKDIERVGRDIRHIKPDLEELTDHTQLHTRLWFWLVQGLMPAAFVAVLLYQRHQHRLGGDVAYVRRRRARSEANRRLQTALKLLDAGEAVEFHAEIHRALTSFIADRLNLPVASLTNASQLSEELLERGMDDQTVRRLAEVVERCEFGRFAATPPSGAAMAKLRDQAAGLLQRLEGLK